MDVLAKVGPTLALDPGGTTGCCLWLPGHGTKPDIEGTWVEFEAGRFLFRHMRVFDKTAQLDDHHEDLWEFLNDCYIFGLGASSHTEQSLTIVCESFEYRKERDREYISYISGNYIGVVKLFWMMHRGSLNDVRLVMQQASLAKGGFWKDPEKLKKIGLWNTKFAPHGMDALRHFLYYACFGRGNDNSIMHMLKPTWVKSPPQAPSQLLPDQLQ